MGIFGDQISDNALTETKLAEAVRTKLNTAAPPGPIVFENKTEDFTITVDDHGKYFTNEGATKPVVGRMSAGLPVGFKVTAMCLEAGFLITLRPDVSDQFYQSGSADPFYPGQGIYQTPSSVGLDYTREATAFKVTDNLFLPSGQFDTERVALEMADVTAMDGAADIASYITSQGWTPDFTISIKQAASPFATLGSVDEAGVFTKGATLGSPEPVYLEIDNHVSNGFRMSSSVANPLTVTYDSGQTVVLLNEVRIYLPDTDPLPATWWIGSFEDPDHAPQPYMYRRTDQGDSEVDPIELGWEL